MYGYGNFLPKRKAGGGGPSAPVNTVAPVISGTAVVGQTLSTTNGTWDNSPTSYSYQWKRGATNIGTNSSTYTLVQADAGNTSNITCVVTATNAGGSANATSNQIAQILTVRTSAFLTASAISDATIRGGLNTFDIGLIANSLDTKMRALYPFVGGTASTHRWNFMNAVDTNAAFRLVFFGSGTHSSNGYLPNGTNAYADTFLNISSNLSISSAHASYYSRTNIANTGFGAEMGVNGAYGSISAFILRTRNSVGGGQLFWTLGQDNAVSASNADGAGHFIGNSTSTTNRKVFRNGTSFVSSSLSNGGTLPNLTAILGAAFPGVFSSNECSFASIGDGLTDTDATNLYNLTQALQTTLGRSIGPQTVSDPDAQAFVTAADIQDQVQANAVNTLVIGMKAQGLWTKTKAVYPMVGGTATSHMYNLKDPRNLDAAFRLSFSGSWVHSSTGALPNGTNAYADTFLNPSIVINDNNDGHLSYYSRTNNTGINAIEIGCGDSTTSFDMVLKFGGGNVAGACINMYDTNVFTNTARTDGFYVASQNNVNDIRNLYRNTTSLATQNVAQNLTPTNYTVFIGARNGAFIGTPTFFTNRECAFASVGNGLSATDVTNLYNLTQQFQTTLGRQINP